MVLRHKFLRLRPTLTRYLKSCAELNRSCGAVPPALPIVNPVAKSEHERTFNCGRQPRLSANRMAPRVEGRPGAVLVWRMELPGVGGGSPGTPRRPLADSSGGGHRSYPVE